MLYGDIDARFDPTSYVIDDFEDGDLAEYTNTSGWAATDTGEVREGTHSLHMDSSAGPAAIYSMPGDGLKTYPAPGDEWELTFLPQGTSGWVYYRYGRQDADNYYYLQLDLADDDLVIGVNDAGTTSNLLHVGGVGYNAGAWHTIRVDWDDSTAPPTHTVTLENATGTQIAQDEVQDSAHTSQGGVQFSEGSTDGDWYFDDWRLAGQQTPDVIDSFEDQDFAEYSGFPAYFHIDGDAAIDGRYSAQSDDDQYRIYAYSHPGDGLAHYPQKGDIFEYHVRASALNSMGVSGCWWGVVDGAEDDNHYTARVLWDTDEIELSVEDGGTLTQLATASEVGLSADTWVNIRVEWDDGTLGGTDNDIRLTVTGIDNTGRLGTRRLAAARLAARGAATGTDNTGRLGVRRLAAARLGAGGTVDESPRTELASLSATDSTHATAAGVGFQEAGNNTDEQHFFDYFHKP